MSVYTIQVWGREGNGREKERKAALVGTEEKVLRGRMVLQHSYTLREKEGRGKRISYVFLWTLYLGPF